jgi:hypothetical protein
MINALSDLMQEYNTELARMQKAMDYMDGPASNEEKNKWVPEFKAIEEFLNGLINKIGQSGYKMSDDEILNGFSI